MATLIIDTLANNPALAELYWNRFGALKNDALLVVLERAQRRGQIRATVDVQIILDVLNGYVLYQLLVKPPSQAFQTAFESMVDVLVAGIGEPAQD